mmetsp:Transcript_2072/g.3185  ORF Transcript_2072/g.3185 Transcript_2072/m.3185 type:complete len:264 (-) Transcript_2072:326-1117(-)
MSLLHQGWILNAGGSFVENKTASDQDDAKCEVSPLVSYEGEDLEQLCLAPIGLPFYLPSQVENFESSGIAPITHGRPSVHFISQESSIAQWEQQVQMNSGASHNQWSTVQFDYEGERADQTEELPPTARDYDAETAAEALARSEKLNPRSGRVESQANFSAMKAFLEDEGGESEEEEKEEEETIEVGDKGKGLEIDLFAESHQKLRRQRYEEHKMGHKKSILGRHLEKERIGGSWFRNTGRQGAQQTNSKSWWTSDGDEFRPD